MSSLVIGAAKDALLTKTGLPEIDKAGSGGFVGKTVTSWAFYLFIAGSVVGAIAAVAALAFTWYAVSVVGLVLCLSNAFAAFYVKRFAVLKTLEDYTKILALRIKAFAANIGTLKKENDELGKINLELQKVPKNWKTEIDNGAELFAKKTEELEMVTVKLSLAEKKLEQFAVISQKMKDQTDKLSQEAIEFCEENEFLAENVMNVKQQLVELDKHNDKLVGHITDLDAQNDQTEEIMKQFSSQNKALEAMFTLMKDMYLQAKEKMKGLEEQVHELGTVVPQAVESSEKVEALAKQYEEMVQNLGKKLDKFERYQKGHKQWKAWINSQEYQAYLTWKQEQ